jgi:hypothetical protein
MSLFRFRSFQAVAPVSFLLLSSICFAPTAAAQDLPRFGVQAKASTLGVGVDAATSVTNRSNLRFGFNALNVQANQTKDGIHYDASLSLRSVQATYDYYLLGGFHVSPGVLIYNGNKLTANAFVPGGQWFNLSGTGYLSDPGNPVNGDASVALNKTAPMLLLGVGNLLPRSSRHFTVNFDFGVVFQGSPAATLNLNGSACDPRGLNCQNVATNAVIQGNIQAEQAKLNHDLRPFKYYPVLSLGFGWKF